MGRKNNLDKFYTKKEIASYCISLLKIEGYKYIIEPSAGSGSFSQQILGCQAYDIRPEGEGIIKQDFFTLDTVSMEKPILVIGNPPFGRQNSLALAFIKKSATFADTIAFILPKSFKKESLKARIPLNFHLTLEVDLPDFSFTLNGEDIDIPCIFQIWDKPLIPCKRKLPEILFPTDFCFVKKSDNPNVTVRRVGVYAGKGYKDIDKSEQSHYFIIAENVDNFLKIVNNIKWEHNNTVGARSISKQELIRKYKEI